MEIDSEDLVFRIRCVQLHAHIWANQCVLVPDVHAQNQVFVHVPGLLDVKLCNT